MRKLWIIILIILSVYFLVNIGDTMNIKQREFAKYVLQMAYEAKESTGLPASIVAAQCILESGWGEYAIGNNYFGIKSDGSQPFRLSLTYEYDNKTESYYQITARFRVYDSLRESIMDYGRFIYENPRYRFAIANRLNPVRYIEEIQYAGYATCPTYSTKILRIAEACSFLTVSKWKK